MFNWLASPTTPFLTILFGIVTAGSLYAQTPSTLDIRPINGLVDENNYSRLTMLPVAAELPAKPTAVESPPIVLRGLEQSDLPTVPPDLRFPSADVQAALQLITPWWTESSRRCESDEIPTDLEELVWLAIANSPHVQAVLLEPQILDQQASQALGAFDPNRFVDSIFKDTSDPVGNSLITGGPSRLNDNLWENRIGVRGKNQYGGQTEFYQEALFKNSNSRFFVPGSQSDSRLVLQYTQPLKRGRGAAYNRSSFVIASITADQGRYQAAQSLQEHTYQITEAYWSLYVARVSQMQIQRGIANLEKLHDRLQGRGGIDSLRSQILRAEAAVAKQHAAFENARAQMRASEASLKALVAAPQLRGTRSPIVPTTDVFNSPPEIDPANERAAALENQPRVLEVQQEIKAARTKLHVAQNELLPTLNLVLQGYLHGLSGDYQVFESLGDQFTKRPSYHAGIAYQRPKANITAQAIARESRMELRRALLRLDDTLLTVGANVETALAGVEAAYQQLDSAVRATLATQAEIEFLEAQWNNAFLASEPTNSLQLDQLLTAHIQLIGSENAWAQAERDYMLALARLKLATGTLLPTFPVQ